jgi:hypothetical protein
LLAINAQLARNPAADALAHDDYPALLGPVVQLRIAELLG